MVLGPEVFRLALVTLAVACLTAGAGSQLAAASGTPDLIDVVSLAGTTSSGQPVSIVPLLTSGGLATVGASISVPSGASKPLTMSGSASSEGFLNLSANGKYLTFAGYAAPAGTTGVASTTSASVKRVAGRVDASGAVDTSTAVAAFTQNNARSAVSDDGTHVWLGGAGTNDSPKTAVYFANVGASAATGLTPGAATGSRDVVIAGGNLYLSTTNGVTNGIYQVGSGLPTSNSPAPTLTPLETGGDPDGFALVQLGGGPALDTLYVADGTAGGITKFSFNGTTWVNEGTAGAGTKLFGLAAKVENGGVQLYATTANVVAGNSVVSFFDAGGAGAAISSGALTTVATSTNGATFRGVAFAPMGQTFGVAPPSISLADSALSRSIGDSYDPTQTTAAVSDPLFPAGELTVTASSDNTTVVPSVAVSGSGATRTLTVTSNDTVGLANITLTVTTPDGRSASAVLQYGVSAAAPDATSTFLYDFSDASTALDAGGGYYLVGDDEFNQPALYREGVSGPPVKTWNFDSLMGVADTSQIDIEASARLGNTIYWLGSQGNNSTGDVKDNRAILFATTVTGTGASTELTFAGYYKNLRNDFLAWDAANNNRFGFVAGTAQGQIPKEANGYNIEGAEFAPGGSSTLYVGFRAPVVNGQALVVPVTNLTSLISSSGEVGSATFGTPFLWHLTPSGYTNPNGDTSALTVREIRKNADDQYLIIAGSFEEVPPAPSGGAEFLYTWDGSPAHQPVLTNTVLPTIDAGSWESIVSVPDPLVDGGALTMIQDDGDDDNYGTGQEAKDLDAGLQKDRADVIDVALAPQTVAFTTAPPSPAYSGTPYTPAANGGGSGNPVVISIDSASTPGTCSLTGGHVLLVHPGTCIVDADQAGSFQYLAARASQSFAVVLPPPPVVTVPADQTLEATGPSGAPLTFSASATDVVDGSIGATCVPPSNTIFPLGSTTVTCSATDSQHVTGTGTFVVKVQDTKPPAIGNVPANISVPVSVAVGAVATYSLPTAVDVVSGPVPVSCSPASGSTFPVGTTTVTCNASDAAGNTATATFTVTVTVPSGPTTVTGDVTCVNGTYYHAAITGNVTVPQGSVCRLLGSSVSGNVQVQGGALVDDGSAIGGNLQVGGAAWIDLHGGRIQKNLAVQGVSGQPPASLGDGATANDLCAASVGGDVQVQANSGPFGIGGAPDCEAPLTVAGNLQVQSNTGSVAVAGNVVQGNIEVQSNHGGGTLTGNSSGNNCHLQNDSPPIAGSDNNAAGHDNTCNRSA